MHIEDIGISIHALREEGDPKDGGIVVGTVTFLSTPSARRATLSEKWEKANNKIFLSTPSARRATLT